MKKILLTCMALFCAAACIDAQQGLSAEDDPAVRQYLAEQGMDEDENGQESAYVKKEKIVPAAKRPQPPAADKVQAVTEANLEHASQKYTDECTDTFLYGIEDQISEMLDTLTKEEDPRFMEEAYDLFQKTKSPVVRQKILAYFTKLKDPCLEDYAVTVINDPYDEKRDTVSACFSYVAAVKTADAIPGAVDLVDKDDEQYFDAALNCLGEIGTDDEAVFLSEYIERDDLTKSQKQSLVRVLGKLKAVATYEKVAELAEDENQDSFVRMYAAEAIGAMKVPEAEEVLLDLFESRDANLRASVVKGMKNFDDQAAVQLLIEALRDSQYKVRLEAVTAVDELDIKDAVPYLVYRCKDNGEQQQVKDKCYDVIAKLNTAEGNEYLVGLITGKKTGDTTKGKVAASLLKYNYAGSQEIVALAGETLKNDIQKKLRYTLGKEFAKYGRPEYAGVCAEFIASKDVMTQGTGLDIYAKGRYAEVTAAVQALADSEADGKKKSRNVNVRKAKRILGIDPDAAEDADN